MLAGRPRHPSTAAPHCPAGAPRPESPPLPQRSRARRPPTRTPAPVPRCSCMKLAAGADVRGAERRTGFAAIAAGTNPADAGTRASRSA
eukprot:364057-Chlamydomonas_euryale.AAC.1